MTILPHRDSDPVQTLYAHYYLAADLMRKNYRASMNKLAGRGSLSVDERSDLSIYLCTWLGFLAVTAEGCKQIGLRQVLQSERPASFQELLPITDQLGRFIKQHDDLLRRFRNDVFHLRKDTQSVEQFFAGATDALKWADGLHDLLAQFFSSYRVLCRVHEVLGKHRGDPSMKQ